MSKTIEICDNNYTGTDISDVCTQEEEIASLSKIANQSLRDLADNEKFPKLLVFPHCLGKYQDENGEQQDGIGKQHIFDLNGNKMTTGNVVGFCGVDGIDIHIRSRFDSHEKQYFLHHMLSKVFGINILNLPTSPDKENIWDFLIYLFPYLLKKAMRQGLYRAYRTFHYNDAKVKGTIDVAEHIKRNIPFAGKIAYQVRERTANNHVLHLIRHTIEVIRKHPYAGEILNNDSETRECVLSVIDATPDFSPQNLSRIMVLNSRPVRHPFYTEYTPLQKLCLQILRHEKITYGSDDNEIHGILFDAAWLWEEYLATVLSSSELTHARNKQRTNGIKLFNSGVQKGYTLYPDFHSNAIIADAKYKRLIRNGQYNVSREDKFQIISYMYITKVLKGVLVFPVGNEDKSYFDEYERGEYKLGELNGYGGTFDIYGINIPQTQDTNNFVDFSQKMEENANKFVEWIAKFFWCFTESTDSSAF